MAFRQVKAAALLFLLLLPWKAVQGQETWLLPVPDTSRPPFTILEAPETPGIFVELMQEIGRRIGVRMELEPLPTLRRREFFTRGLVVVDCCLNPLWRQRPDEQSVQLFSETLVRIPDIFLFPAESVFPIRNDEDLNDKRVIGILGYSYRNEAEFGERINAKSPEQMLRILNGKRGDVGILQWGVAQYYIQKLGLAIELGPAHHIAPLHIRLHRSKAEYLPKINEAVEYWNSMNAHSVRNGLQWHQLAFVPKAEAWFWSRWWVLVKTPVEGAFFLRMRHCADRQAFCP